MKASSSKELETNVEGFGVGFRLYSLIFFKLTLVRIFLVAITAAAIYRGNKYKFGGNLRQYCLAGPS